MLINFKVKTLDAQTHDLSIDNELTVRELKDKIAEKTNIVPEQQRIIYCGRVLADEKQMKDYDVDGKVLHVAERPPPSQGGPTSRTNDNPPPRERSTLRGMRNSPLFRALDSMVTGLPNNGGPPINPFASSSSFCMNRITVARHMLDCANNIAAYLENPERGLNNSSLDILQRGRWTIESTVVEVGITAADLPQNQNIVEMVQGAVSAALRGSGGTNVTVLQLPTVFEQQDNESGGGVTSNSITAGAAGLHAGNDAAALAGVGGGGVGSTSSDTGTSGNAAATVILEDMSDSDDEQLEVQYNRPSESGSREDGQSSSSRDNVTPASSMEANVGSSSNTDVSTTATSSSSTGTNTDQSSSVPGNRRRTPPTVLAEVIELWRNVQARLNPFIQQYYELLQNEPTFEENSTERESAQRLFDRVSEAFHYLSHAQHAISDLMLDLTQPTPRFLTCHPILVEQSGYISSNNFLSAGPAQAAAASAANLVRGHLRGRPAANMLTQQQRQTQTDYVRRNVNSTATNTNISGNVQSAAATSTSGRFEDPVDEAPTTMAPRPPSMNVGTQSSDHGQLPMARLIQAVVNSAPIDTEFHVQINAPIVSFGVPVHVATVHTDAPNQVQQHSSISAAVEAVVSAAARQAAQTAAASAAAANATATSTTTAAAATTTGGNTTTTTAVAAATATTTANNTQTRSRAGSDQVRVTTATLPTTSTQTRSTSRPQLQIGQLPPGTFNGTRFVPNSMMSSFDRFLQCNSHHIRESENASAAPGSGGGGSNNGTNATNTPQIGMHSQIITPQGLQLGTNGANGAAAGVMFPSPFLNMSSSGARPTIGRARPSLASVTRELPPIPTSDNPEENRRVFLNMLSDIRQHLDTLPNARLIMPELASELDELAAAGSAATNATTPSTAAAGAGASTTQAAAPRSNSSSNSTTPRRQAPSAAAAAASTAAASSTASAPAPAAAGSASSAPRPLLAALPNVFAVEAYRINLRTQLLNFLTERIFQGNEINEETIPTAVSRAIHWFSDMIIFLPQYEKPQYNSRASVVNILRSTLPLFINLVNDRQQSNVQFEQRLKQIFEQFIRRLYCVMCQCIGDNNTELYWMQLMRALLVPLRSNFRDEALQFLCVYINTRTPFVLGVENNHDAQQFIVKRSVALENNQDSSSDVDMNEVASTSASASARDSADETLPSVVAGSEPWHINFPNDWLPLITRDVQTLNETPSAQPPYSDAYIAGMATKRRKVLQTNKPPATVNGLLANNVRCALQATENVTPLTATPTTATTTTEAGTGSGGGGSPTAAAADSTSTSSTITTAAAATDDAAAGSLQGASVTPTATATATTSTDTSATATDDSATTTSQEQSPANSHLEEIINSIVNDTSVQASYAEALQTSLRERLRHDNDYDSSKFPEIGKYLNNK